MNLILNKSQANAIYSAMCALNAVQEHAGQISIGEALVTWRTDGHVAVASINNNDREAYDLQGDFATAYGLDHGGEPQNAVAADAGDRARDVQTTTYNDGTYCVIARKHAVSIGKQDAAVFFVTRGGARFDRLAEATTRREVEDLYNELAADHL